MSNIVKELAVSAIVENIASPIWAFTDREFEHFIALLKYECVQLCESNYVNTIGSHSSAHNSAVKKCVESITQIFEG